MKISDYTVDSLFDHWKRTGDLFQMIQWIRWKLDDIKSRIIVLFEMDEETANQFYSWGHNSAYACVFHPYLAFMLAENEDHVRNIMRHIELTCNPEDDPETDTQPDDYQEEST